MSTDKFTWFWLAATGVLILIIIASSLSIWINRERGQPLVIMPPETIKLSGEIYVEGAIANPGLYPLRENDGFVDIIQASGGATNEADLTQIRLYIPYKEERQEAQKIDINRADVWLLEALPDIGNTKAQAIVDYRQQNGFFHNINEITRVPGISQNTFEKIKSFISLSD